MTGAAVFLDTSYVIALDNKDDLHHVRAMELARELRRNRTSIVLHWGILLEIGDGYARMSRRPRGRVILDMLRTRAEYRISEIDQPLFESGLRLFDDRPDKEWGLTDCVSFELMRAEGIAEALTADDHFRQAGFVPLLVSGAK